jgi:transcriptional antiterminator NusG
MGGGPGNPVDIINEVIDAHQQALSQEQPKGTRVRGLYATMVSAARAQIKAQRDLTKAEIENLVCCMIQPAPAPKAEDVLAKIDVMLTALISAGEKSPEVSEARALIRARLMEAQPQPIEVEAQMRWWAVPCKSGSENEVAESFRDEIKKREVADLVEKVMVPSPEEGDTERKFLRGYVLVKAKLTDEAYQLIKKTPRVKRGPRPMPISDEEAERVLRGVEEEQPKPQIEVGDQVRVSDGPFISCTGTVEEVDEDRERMKVAVSIFGQETPVDIGFSEIEKV